MLLRRTKKPQIVNVSESSDSSTSNGYKAAKKLCRYCNKSHRKGECPAFGKRCTFCNGWNHVEDVCFKKKKKSKNKKRNKNRKVSSLIEDLSSLSEDVCELFIGSLEIDEVRFTLDKDKK